MGNFDAAAVIQAAATSNLGVVSLLVLVLAFLAWRFFQRSEDKVKLIAFAMMFLGAAGFVTAVMVAGGDAEDTASDGKPAETPAPVPTGTGAPVETVSASGTANIAGAWHDADGYSYAVVQNGNAFSYTFASGGAQIGRGTGTIAGTHMTYSFANDDGSTRGTCEADVASDARAIKGRCSDGPSAWTFIIER